MIKKTFDSSFEPHYNGAMDTMATPLYIIVLATLAVSLVGLLGGIILFLKERFARRWTNLLICFSAGSILGATFFNLFPEALSHPSANVNELTTAVLIGIFVFYVLEKFLVWHHHAHGEIGQHHTEMYHRSLASVRPLIIIGDALHNMLDGAVIAIAFIANTKLGIVTSLAIIAHEIPQEIGDFSILLSSGMSKKRVLFWNVTGALVALVGAVLVFFAREHFESIELPMLGFVIGNFIYISLSDLLPSIKHNDKFSHNLGQIGIMCFGAAIIYFLGLLLPSV